MENEEEGRSGEKGKENAGTKEEEEEKGGGEKGTESFFNEQIFIQNRIKPTNYTCIYTQNIILPITPPLTTYCYSIRPRNAFPKTNNIFL